MPGIVLTSALGCEYKDSAEQIFFHNREQGKVSQGALLAVEQYGVPRISTANGRVWVILDSGISAQSLYVLEEAVVNPPLIGLVVYTREDDTLVVLFVAIREDFTDRGTRADEELFFHLVNEVGSIAHRVKGLTRIKWFVANPPPVISVGTAMALTAPMHAGEFREQQPFMMETPGRHRGAIG
jgi:hypothetical protein